MNRFTLGFVLVLACWAHAVPVAEPEDAAGWRPDCGCSAPALPFVPTMFGDGRTSPTDGIPSSRVSGDKRGGTAVQLRIVIRAVPGGGSENGLYVAYAPLCALHRVSKWA